MSETDEIHGFAEVPLPFQLFIFSIYLHGLLKSFSRKCHIFQFLPSYRLWGICSSNFGLDIWAYFKDYSPDHSYLLYVNLGNGNCVALIVSDYTLASSWVLSRQPFATKCFCCFIVLIGLFRSCFPSFFQNFSFIHWNVVFYKIKIKTFMLFLTSC